MVRNKFFNSSFCVLTLMWISSLVYSEEFTLNSPDNEIKVTVTVDDSICYQVFFHDKLILDNSALGLNFLQQTALKNGLSVEGCEETICREIEYSASFWKNKVVEDKYNGIDLPLTEKENPNRKIEIQFRVYNDGVAFRYSFPKQSQQELFLTRENTSFNFTSDYTAWMADYKAFKSSQESEFIPHQLSTVKDTNFIGLPMLVEIENGYLAITEANLRNWAGMYINTPNVLPNGNVNVGIKQPPLPSKSEALVRISTQQHTPWRVIMMADTLGELVESDLVYVLADSCEIDNTDWIKPGFCAWDSWWSNGVNQNNETIKKYIDFASDMGFPYQLIDWHWYGDPFGEDWIPKEKMDITKWSEKIDLPELIKYAQSKNVKLWLWLLSPHADAQYEEAFPLYEKWGIAGVKIDFMDRDDQEMVQWYEKIIKKAAEHHLMVNFHGAYKNAGLERTYPNFMTREGVMGNEYNIWSERVTPEHNVTIPFTRMLAGPMDYTPGGMLNEYKEDFKQGYPTHVMGTRCHELAKFVVYFSPITTVCGNPDNFYTSNKESDSQAKVKLSDDKVEHSKWLDGIEFLTMFYPDELVNYKVLDGEIGKYIVVARKDEAGRWFIGAMTNSSSRKIEINLDFLENEAYNGTVFFDNPETRKNPQIAGKKEQTYFKNETLMIDMAPSGGWVGVFVPTRDKY